ncbi:MAG TPA: phosphoenolpyruvate--protein phosphotransferase [Candidatus Deferrimicrobium sp.]|nr:phosphoenolpyruvate--protein phosphotransferase [Candidatus Deferrimicrobium sp.]
MNDRRRVIKGTSISAGIALGQARVVIPGEVEIVEVTIAASRVKDEIAALDRAIARTVEELRALRVSAGKKIGGPVAKIFDAQFLIAEDQEFIKTVRDQIAAQRRNAAFVYHRLVQHTTAPLKQSQDVYMQRMVVDIEAVTEKVLSHLAGHDRSELTLAANTILIGKMFTPNDIVSYRERRAIGFLVSEGGPDSHMALIARSLLVPAVLAENVWQTIPNDCPIIVDGTAGEIIVHPTEKDWSEYQKRKKRLGPAIVTRIKQLTRIPPVTADGMEITVAANLTLPGPADDILAGQKIPVGLYRTEFLYMAHRGFPDEDVQFQYFDRIAARFADTTVVFRTFDLGYDKSISDRNWPQEDNPALGWRGIRAMLELDGYFKTQLRAILRASTRRNVKILLPMVTEVSEVERARKLIAQIKFALTRERVPFDPNIEVGIMVEVPAAAMIAETLATRVDFMSIGTNDLAQYALAADRANRKVAHLYNPYHPSVLQLISMTVTACKKHRRPVSICGEMAGDMLALPLFIGMDVDVLSMSPARIFDLCRAVKKIDSSVVRHLVGVVLSSGSVKEVLTTLEDFKRASEKRKP